MGLTVRAAEIDTPARWQAPTTLINSDHPRVRALAGELTSTTHTEREAALRIFTFVRDQVRFGFARGFWDNRASDVLRHGVGYCNTKSTLFIALLRAAGIAARPVFVAIDSNVLHGIIDPGTPYVDHAYTEVFLNGRWIPTDAYIVDPPLFHAAQTRTLEEGRVLGYGVHATGTLRWDGETAAFSQFNQLDPRPISNRHWGVYQDVADFYARAQQPANRLNAFLRLGFGLMAGTANARAEQLRQRAG